MLNFSGSTKISFGKQINQDLRALVGGRSGNSDLGVSQASSAKPPRTWAPTQQAIFVMTTDKNGIITSVSPSFERFTGYTASECIGKRPSFLQGDNTSATARAEFQALIVTRKQGKINIINYRKNGESFVNEVALMPMNDADGNFEGFTSVHAAV